MNYAAFPLGVLIFWIWLACLFPENTGKWLGKIHRGYQIEMRVGDGK